MTVIDDWNEFSPQVQAIVYLSEIHPTGYKLPSTQLTQTCHPELDFTLSDFDKATKVVHREFMRDQAERAKRSPDQPTYAVARPDVDSSPSGWEAKIRVMKLEQVKALAAANDIRYEPVAPNNGVLSMRIKNALYHAIRQGVELKHVEG